MIEKERPILNKEHQDKNDFLRQERDKKLDQAFNEALSGLEIRTQKERRIDNMFGLLDSPLILELNLGKK